MIGRKKSKFARLMQIGLLGLLFLAGAVACSAQFGSNVQGTVTDQTGAVVPNVAITLHNTATGVDLKNTTNATGFYRFEAVVPGHYTVIATQPGFKISSVAAEVTTDATRGVDVILVPAGGTTNVTVSSVAPELNQEETRIQATLSSDEINNLPFVGHDVEQLLALTPGITGYDAAGPGSSSFSSSGTWAPAFQANGSGNNSNLYLLDDLPVSDDINQGGATIMPNSDMLAQVAMQTQTYSVENGSSASLQTSFTSKGGTNKFHGDLSYTYAGANIGAARQVGNSIVAATGTTPAYGIPYDSKVGAFHQNFILGSIGGPIWKDKTFFFFSFQKLNSASGYTQGANQDDWDPAFIKWGLTTFPNSGTAKALTLDPNSLDVPGPGYSVKTVEDVLNSYYGNTTACPSSSSNYVGTIPTFVNGALSGPNKGATQGGETYTIPCSTPMYDSGLIANLAGPINGLQWNARVDQVFRNGSDRIYAMFDQIHQTSYTQGDRPNGNASTPTTNKYGSINWVHVFTPRLLNEIHAGNVRVHDGLVLSNPAVGGSIPYGMNFIDAMDNGTVYSNYSGSYQNLFSQTQTFAPNNNLEHSYNVRDTLSYNWHNHTFRGGYQFTREDYLINQAVYARGGFGFNFVHDDFAEIANEANYNSYLWTISATTGNYLGQLYGATSIYNGVWVDDSWKVLPSLTITAGLRYDDFGNPSKYSNSGPFAPLYPGAGSTMQEQFWHTATHVSAHAFTESQSNQWQPRVGFAYTPFKGKELTIHGGIGLYENVLTPSQIATNLPTQPPSRLSLNLYQPMPFGDFTSVAPPYGETYDNSLPFPIYGTDPFGNSYNCPAATDTPDCTYSTSLNGFTPTIKPEKFLLYSLGIEKEFPAGIVASIVYSGSHGYNLVTGAIGSGANGVGNSDWNLTPSTNGVLPTTRPDTEWSQLRYSINSNDTSNFNALILSVRQHRGGLSYQANYNWERSLQWAPTFNDSAAGNIAFWPGIYASHTYYGPSENDVTNSFSLGGSYVTPKIPNANYFLNEAVAGWTISTITVAQSGAPFSVGNAGGPSYAFDNSWNFDNSGGGTPAFPTYASGLRRKGFSRAQFSKTGIFTAADFSDPAGAGVSGPVASQQGANTFRGPGYFNVNASLAKEFALPWIGKESSSLTLRGDFINLLNRTNWVGPVNDISEGTNFGFSTTALTKRFLQLGARFQF